MGDRDGAPGHCTRALERDAGDLLARSCMGQGLLERGDFAGAKQQLEETRARGGAGNWAQAVLTGVSMITDKAALPCIKGDAGPGPGC